MEFKTLLRLFRFRISWLTWLILLFPLVVQAESEGQGHDSGQDDLKQGRRFFYGLLPKDLEAQSCVSCHNVAVIDTFNWNPSAYELGLKYKNAEFSQFKSAVNEPQSGKMLEVHQNYSYSDEELRVMMAYLTEDVAAHEPEGKPVITNLLLFLLLGFVMTLALIDLFITKFLPYKLVHVLILVGGIAWQLKMVSHEAIALGRSENYEPDQPIKFSHKVHATDNKIDCKYCHHTAEQSKTANIPSTELCMNCHIVVREGTHSGRFEIEKLVRAHDEGRSVEWIRIHKLPDHVFFSHAQHVGAGKLDCAQCHGEVEQMHRVQQVSDLSMGWCLECHRETQVDFVDNDYYKTFEALHKELVSGKKDSIVAADIGANDCAKCHY